MLRKKTLMRSTPMGTRMKFQALHEAVRALCWHDEMSMGLWAPLEEVRAKCSREGGLIARAGLGTKRARTYHPPENLHMSNSSCKYIRKQRPALQFTHLPLPDEKMPPGRKPGLMTSVLPLLTWEPRHNAYGNRVIAFNLEPHLTQL